MWRVPRGHVPETWSPSVEQLVEELSVKLAPADVSVLGSHVRPQWLLIELLVHPGRRLFAKLALPEGSVGDDVERPRLVPVVMDGRRLRSEGDALSRLDAAVAVDDPDLAAVSVVHRQESPAALVVDWVDGRALSLALGPGPRPGTDGPPQELLRKAGRWLRLFHSLTDDEPVAYHYPADVLKWLGEVAEFLGPRPRRWASLVEELSRAVERHAHLAPHVALHHGDMAARNLMVRNDGKIVGIDAGVEWRAPRSHDLAVFLTDLRIRSPIKLRHRVPDFIQGYGYPPGESPTSAIFLAISLVDRYLAWSVRVEEGQGAATRRSIEGVRLNRLADELHSRIQECMR